MTLLFRCRMFMLSAECQQLTEVSSRPKRSVVEGSAVFRRPKLLRIVLDPFHRVTKNLFQTLRCRGISLPVILVDLIPVTHSRPRKSNQLPADHPNVAAMQWIAEHSFHCMPVQQLK